MKIRRFDVCMIDMGEARYSEQNGVRPGIVIQNDIGNAYSPTVIVVPLTCQIKKSKQPTHCIINPTTGNGLHRLSMAMAEQVRVIGKERVTSVIGTLDKDDRKKVVAAYIANITGEASFSSEIVVA